jgi:membrane protein
MAMKAFSRLTKVLTGVYSGAESELSRLERIAHLWALVLRSFARNRCPARAAALSYTSLLALIPLLAVAISFTSGFLKSEGEEKIYQALDKFVSNVMPPATLGTNEQIVSLNLGQGLSLALTPTNPPAVAVPTNNPAATNLITAETDTRVVAAQKEVARNIRDFIQNTRSGTLGTIGMLLLIVVAIQMLASVEETFNDIWGVTRGRNWLWRIVLYWTTITLGPLALVGALGLAGSKHLKSAELLVNQMPFVGSLFFQFLPLLVLTLTFTLIYQLVPNTRVRFSAAFVGGVVAGSLWYVNNVFGFLYVSRVVSNSKIYGSIGLVPVFMIGLYFSWLIILFGAQVAYAFQNRKAYLQDKLAENVNQRGREFIALRLMTCIGQRFQRGLPPVTIQEISTELDIPTKLSQQVLHTLLASRLVTEIVGAEAAYAPARPLDSINAYHILHAMRAGGGQELLLRDEPVRAEVYGEFARIEEAERQVAGSVTLFALVNRAHARLELAAPTAASLSSSKSDKPPRTRTKDEKKPGEPPGAIKTVPLAVKPPDIEPPTPPAPTVPPPEKRGAVVPDEDKEFPL